MTVDNKKAKTKGGVGGDNAMVFPEVCHSMAGFLD